jgi:hypothetical protein
MLCFFIMNSLLQSLTFVAEVNICLLYVTRICLHGIHYSLIVQARLTVGDIVECTIKRFVYFGIFVEVGLVPSTAV